MTNKYTILIVEDEDSISGIMQMIFKANDYQVVLAKSGREAMMMVTSRCPDVVILDLGLPDMDGMNIIKSIRAWSSIPIIVVSARTQERDKVEALDLGADDYITKPFGTAELLARVRTEIRHSNALVTNKSEVQEGVFTVGNLQIDYDKRRVYVRGIDVLLTQNEYKMVSLLAKYVGKVLTYDYLMQHIWGPHAKGDNQILRVNMANIRRKIEDNPADPVYIITEMGMGYRMVECVMHETAKAQ